MSQHFISLEKAKAMTAKFRGRQNHFVKDEFKNKIIWPISETFTRDAFDKLLTQSGCTGLRIYYGMDDNDGIHAVIVGINDKNEDILPNTSNIESLTTNTYTTTSTKEGIIIEDGKICPPLCAPTSLLNS